MGLTSWHMTWVTIQRLIGWVQCSVGRCCMVGFCIFRVAESSERNHFLLKHLFTRIYNPNLESELYMFTRYI